MASSCGESEKHSSEDALSSSICAKSGRIGPPNLDMTGGDDVKRLLECPICLEIFVPPIYQCQRGHNICSTCKPKLTKCPSCEAPFGTTQNFGLEKLLESVAFSCNYHHKGCDETLKIQDLQQHHKICEHRPLKCHLSDTDNCNGTLLSLADTLSHLQNTHKLKTIKSNNDLPNVFQSGNWLFLGEGGDDEDYKMTQDGELFHFEENNFVSLVRSIGPLTYLGFYLIGPKSDASKYSVKITIQKQVFQDTIFKNEVTTKFTSIRDFQGVWEDWKLPLELIVHNDVLRRDTKTFSAREIVEDEEEPNWVIVYTIIKL